MVLISPSYDAERREERGEMKEGRYPFQRLVEMTHNSTWQTYNSSTIRTDNTYNIMVTMSITMNRWSVVLIIAIACSISSTIRTVNSFQLALQQSSIKSTKIQQTQSSTIIYESATTTVEPIVESAASQWMEKEKRSEDEIDSRNDAETVDEQSTSSTIDDTSNSLEEPNYTEGRWESLHGNYILRPPPSKKPRALIHFLGGALLGAAPQLTYRYLLERLSSKGYLVVATPYQLSFDHLVSCDEIIDKFERVAPDLARGMLYCFLCTVYFDFVMFCL